MNGFTDSTASKLAVVKVIVHRCQAVGKRAPSSALDVHNLHVYLLIMSRMYAVVDSTLRQNGDVAETCATDTS